MEQNNIQFVKGEIEEAEKLADRIIKEAESQGIDRQWLEEASVKAFDTLEKALLISSSQLSSRGARRDSLVEFYFVYLKYIKAFQLKYLVEKAKRDIKVDIACIYSIGVLAGSIQMQELFLNQDFKKRLDSFRQHGKIINRWQKEKEAMRPALEEAEQLWKNGDARYHNDMSFSLWKKHNLEEKNIRKKKFLKNIRPIARKYGKLLGVKKD